MMKRILSYFWLIWFVGFEEVGKEERMRFIKE